MCSIIELSARGEKQFDIHLWPLSPSIFRQKTNATRPMRDEVDGKVFIPGQSRRINL